MYDRAERTSAAVHDRGGFRLCPELAKVALRHSPPGFRWRWPAFSLL
jgi:hypothetical protein